MDQILRTDGKRPFVEPKGYPAAAMVEELPSIVARQYRQGFALRTVVDPMFRVTVRGVAGPFRGQERVYHIEAASDSSAAFEGLSRFADEMGRLEASRRGS